MLAFQRYPYRSCVTYRCHPPEIVEPLVHRATKSSRQMVPAFCPVQAASGEFLLREIGRGKFDTECFHPGSSSQSNAVGLCVERSEQITFFQRLGNAHAQPACEVGVAGACMAQASRTRLTVLVARF